MVGVPGPRLAADRARWLAELAWALDKARDVVRQLGVEEARIDAIDLAAQIEGVRSEVQRLRLMRTADATAEFASEWTKDVPWRLSA